MSSRCWCTVLRLEQSQRLLLDDWMPLTHGHSVKFFASNTPGMLPMRLSGRLPYRQFLPLFTRDGSTSSGIWHKQIQNRVIEGDCEDTHMPPGYEGLMQMYSLPASGSTQPGRRPMTMCSVLWWHTIYTAMLCHGTCYWQRARSTYILIQLTIVRSASNRNAACIKFS